jgi:hypothetical protein
MASNRHELIVTRDETVRKRREITVTRRDIAVLSPKFLLRIGWGRWPQAGCPSTHKARVCQGAGTTSRPTQRTPGLDSFTQPDDTRVGFHNYDNDVDSEICDYFVWSLSR